MYGMTEDPQEYDDVKRINCTMEKCFVGFMVRGEVKMFGIRNSSGQKHYKFDDAPVEKMNSSDTGMIVEFKRPVKCKYYPDDRFIECWGNIRTVNDLLDILEEP